LTSTSFLIRRRPSLRSALFPYTTLFRSRRLAGTSQRGHPMTLPDPARLLPEMAQALNQHLGRHGIREPRFIGIRTGGVWVAQARSEEHTSELQSRENLVCRLLLEKKIMLLPLRFSFDFKTQKKRKLLQFNSTTEKGKRLQNPRSTLPQLKKL